MANERPVTGSCERCARGHDLLIPEPGSGDLEFQRIGARFSWCAGCARVVGRTCCWDGSVGLCPDCAALRAAPEPLLTDALLTRNALSGLSAGAESMDALERRLRRLRVTDDAQARNAWEDAWLDAGTGIVRADSAVRTARGRGAAASVTPTDAQWLTDRLATRRTTWDERIRAVADRLERVGLRIRALAALDLPAAAPASPAERQLVAVPVIRTLSPVTQLPMPQRASVGARTPAPARLQAPPQTDGAPSTPARETPAVEPDRPAEPSGAVNRNPPIQPAAPPTPSAQPRPSPPVRPGQPVGPDRPVVAAQPSGPVRPEDPPRRPGPAKVAGPVRARSPQPAAPPVLPRPGAAPQPEPRPSASPSGRRRAVIVLVALLTLFGAGVVALASIDRLGGATEPSGPVAGAAPSPDSSPDAVSSPSPSANATTAGAEPGASAPAVTFDLEPLGPLRAEAVGIARVLGAPEVAALPTPFDRSLLLAASGSGACLIGVSGEAARSLAIDLRTGTRPEGILHVTPTDRPAESVAVELGLIAGLAPETWYRVQLAWGDEGAIILDVRERDGGRSVHRGPVAATEGAADGSDTGSVCFEAPGVSDATAMHIDNVRVGS